MTILMIRPVRFGYNAQTAVNNVFQEPVGNQNQVQERALQEFDAMVKLLDECGINLLVVEDTVEPHTPDSIFPNNWISFHDDGTIILYPMFAENRRLERKNSVFDAINDHFIVNKQVDYTSYETEGRFLEGTGSFVLDRENKVAYACLSPRTDSELFHKLCEQIGYKKVIFEAFDMHGVPIYHTNVMMCVADQYAVVNLDGISEIDRIHVIATLEDAGKTIIPITPAQMGEFAGNMLQVENNQRIRHLVMSSRAYRSLDPKQLAQLESFNPIIHAPLNTIEKNGGGSARCMMAEVFLPVNSNGPK